jgi:predicted ferric reductase
LGSELQIRVGGSFVWPPPNVDLSQVKKLVFIAGGVGINPLISIISHLSQRLCPFEIHFLYSTKVPNNKVECDKILFLHRLWDALQAIPHGNLHLFLTSLGSHLASKSQHTMSCQQGGGHTYQARRLSFDDVENALGPQHSRASVLVYICGSPVMTDLYIDRLQEPRGPGLKPHQVMYEKWW